MPYQPERHGPRRVVGPGFHESVYAAVRQVPPGHVTTYGDIAAHLGLRSAARHVGFALAALSPDRDVSWHRVINGSGRISFPPGSERAREQRRRLQDEGLEVTREGRVRGFVRLRFQFGG